MFGKLSLLTLLVSMTGVLALAKPSEASLALSVARAAAVVPGVTIGSPISKLTLHGRRLNWQVLKPKFELEWSYGSLP